MVSLSVIFEDIADGKVQIKSRSTSPLPEDMDLASPADLVMIETTGWIANNYKIKEGGIIDFGLAPKNIIIAG